MNCAGDPAGSGPWVVPFSESIPFSRDYSIMYHTVDGAIAFEPSTSARRTGGTCYVRLIADGVNDPTFSDQFTITSGAYDNTLNVINRIVFLWNGYDYEVSISQLGSIPYIISGETADANNVQILSNEAITGDTTGFTLTANDVPLTILSRSGAGTSTNTFTVSETILNTDVLKLSYNQNTGNTEDSADHILLSFTDLAITNNVTSTVDVTFAAANSLLVNTAQDFTPSTLDSDFDHTGLDAKKIAANTSGRIFFKLLSTAHSFGVLGLSTVNAQNDLWGFSAGIFNSSSATIKIVEGGVQSAGLIGSAPNKYYGIYRNGSTGEVKAQYSDDAITWTDIATFTFNSTANLYILCSLFGGANTHLNTPKGTNIV